MVFFTDVRDREHWHQFTSDPGQFKHQVLLLHKDAGFVPYLLPQGATEYWYVPEYVTFTHYTHLKYYNSDYRCENITMTRSET